jgi:anti-sigma regulatory factor (Ser/Thr protein kinase)/serine/threonine protein phosphatase PrpC
MNTKDEHKKHDDPASRNAHTFTVTARSDIEPVQRSIKNTATSLGFTDRVNDVTLAVTELCTNLLKFAEGGRLTVNPTDKAASPRREGSDQPGLEITVEDSGPGIYDVQRAFADGFSSSDSRGDGLGKINQAVDELDISSGPEGTRVTFRVWNRANDREYEHLISPLEFGFRTRKHPAMDQNGDAFIHKVWGNRALTGVIDGVGHGKLAHKASIKAREYIETHYDMPLESILTGTNRACRGTRGAVAGLARFHWNEESVKLTFSGVGNIECSIVSPSGKESLVSKRGLLGKTFPTPKTVTRSWTEGNKTIFIHSDGIKSHWSLEDFDGLIEGPAPEMANRLLTALARPNDDATIAVIKYHKGGLS